MQYVKSPIGFPQHGVTTKKPHMRRQLSVSLMFLSPSRTGRWNSINNNNNNNNDDDDDDDDNKK